MKIFSCNTSFNFTKPLIISVLLLLVSSSFLNAGPLPSGEESMRDARSAPDEGSGSLVILWTTDDREVALKMIFMYAYNAKKFNWWDDITLIIWGPSSRLLADDKDLQEKIKEITDSGITVKACKGCADQYAGVSDTLSSLGIEVLYVGKEFTDYIKSDAHILTL